MNDTLTADSLFAKPSNIYLLNHSIGRQPLSTQQAIDNSFLHYWRSDSEDIWNHWLDVINDFKAALGALFNAAPNTFCPQTNISGGLTKILQSLPKKTGKNVIVMCENDFPSAGFVLKQAEALGYQLNIIPKTADVQDIDTWAAAIGNNTLCVFISHVHYNTSIRTPVGQICKLARQHDALSIVDIAQSAGVVPIDLQEWNADAVVGSCIKWLCGGPGAGYVWINPELIEQLAPTDVGWFSHANPFEFDIHHFEYASDSARFWGGTPSVVPYAIAANSIGEMHTIGIAAIQKHNQNLIESMIAAVDPTTVISPTGDRLRGGTLVIKPKHSAAVEAALKNAGVMFDARAEGIRLSPHIYNTEEQIDRVKQCLNAR